MAVVSCLLCPVPSTLNMYQVIQFRPPYRHNKLSIDSAWLVKRLRAATIRRVAPIRLVNTSSTLTRLRVRKKPQSVITASFGLQHDVVAVSLHNNINYVRKDPAA